MNILIEISFEANVDNVKNILAVSTQKDWQSSILPGKEQGICIVTWSASRLAPHEAEDMIQHAQRLHRNNFEEEKMK